MQLQLSAPPPIAPDGARSGPPEARPPTGGPLDEDRLGTPTRRAAAWAIDVILVAVPTGAVAYSQAHHEPLSPLPPLPLTPPTAATLTLGGTLYRWSAGGLWLTAVAALLAALIVLTLIPANVEGWTPGQRLLKLRVITTNGTRAQLHHHLVRTVFGVIDLAPFVLPGLVGWQLAARSPRRQRLGDRLARTVVVDIRHPERPADPSRRPRSTWWRQAPVHGPTPDADLRWTIDELDADLAPLIGGSRPIRPVGAQGTSIRPAPVRASPRLQAASNPRPGTGTPSWTKNPNPAARPAPLPTQASAQPTAEPGPTADDTTPVAAPEWDDGLGAWTVWDAETGVRFRHDPTSGRWRPVGTHP